ncbi:S-adenosylmethionine-dependent methyltransferases (SAM or AdoMet-MTase) isoform 1 [Galdieria sulphuraria]|uniref:tRNA (guanine(37)-N1)-methyltransferase n=1 Tax=Galdieria sulphuraria TaxID=130081 RepID=M2Y8G1_GALSU|nr:S-adenosylmethionine-dependent methyltransferases (SAM or AdoMet-MTase) isoform 1 [Galdieria sulphuraria]EME32134.1 S-adenosylmethionine-dependent methyltransferases (SAM or AdoMet-MTase) isoform 1 [Galdieria sulphuraria]|eukprot:XP_005708654.1 S-adenosylmethionine-dependent methyltransferases (SAM or AdoMet-MTase) isoform 1 [Galdieria sulphuraria]
MNRCRLYFALQLFVCSQSTVKNIQVEDGGRKRKLLLRYLTELPVEEVLEDFEHVSPEFINREKELREYLYRTISEDTTYNSNTSQYLKQLLRSAELESLEISYDIRNWPLNKILRRLLPEIVSWPSSFETVGRIIHLNLREELLPYRHLIGNILLMKHYPRIKTVVNKVGETSGPFRTFDMEILSGESNLITEVKENGCVYELDYERVYWNSKLEAERRRVIETFSSCDIIADAFAGVGPFVIPAAKHKGCVAFGNDLNPISTEFLSKNIRRNGVSHLVRASCLDACTFVKQLIEEEVYFTKLIMNYPSKSTEFLHVLKGLYKGREDRPLPIVYCYIFGRGPDPFKDALSAVFEGLTCKRRRS